MYVEVGNRQGKTVFALVADYMEIGETEEGYAIVFFSPNGDVAMATLHSVDQMRLIAYDILAITEEGKNVHQ